MKRVILVLAATLTACAAPAPHISGGNEHSVILKWDTMAIVEVGQLQPVADAQCAKYGKRAKYSSHPSEYEWVFDCVK